VQLVAGTAWLWSRDDMVGSVDILVIDEAGQFSLANALAVAPAAQSLVLVGDPQQLEQPIQGVHPPGVDVSALEHLLRRAHRREDPRPVPRPHLASAPDDLRVHVRAVLRRTSAAAPGLEHQTIVGTPRSPAAACASWPSSTPATRAIHRRKRRCRAHRRELLRGPLRG
jgi:hypothetical protein